MLSIFGRGAHSWDNMTETHRRKPSESKQSGIEAHICALMIVIACSIRLMTRSVISPIAKASGPVTAIVGRESSMLR